MGSRTWAHNSYTHPIGGSSNSDLSQILSITDMQFCHPIPVRPECATCCVYRGAYKIYSSSFIHIPRYNFLRPNGLEKQLSHTHGGHPLSNHSQPSLFELWRARRDERRLDTNSSWNPSRVTLKRSPDQADAHPRRRSSGSLVNHNHSTTSLELKLRRSLFLSFPSKRTVI